MIKEHKTNRFKILFLVYSLTGGKTKKRVPVPLHTNFCEESLQEVIEYLTQEGFVKSYSGNWLELTHKGLIALEDCLSEPIEAKHGFLPVSEINIEL